MTLGEIIIFVFIAIIFSVMIYVGLRLFKWNQKDMAAKKAKNESINKETH